MILVTGASGVLGSALVRRLVAERQPVRALLLPGDAAPRLRGLDGAIEHRLGDLTRPDSLATAMNGVTTVFHAAGVVPFSNRLRPLMQAVNADGARHLLDAALAAGVEDVVHVSSASVFGFSADDTPLDEAAPGWAGPSGYAYVDSKRQAERHMDAVAGRLRVRIVNPGAIFVGDGREPFSWAHLVRRVATGQLAFALPGGVCAVGEQDVVDGLLLAWRHGTPGRRYILATANLSYHQLFGEVCAQTGRPAPRWTAPRVGLGILGAVNALRNRLAGDPLHAGPVNRENAGLLSRRLYYSPARAERELGYRPGPVSRLVADVLRAMAETN